MAYDLNADEIFEMAVHIEANGARFYRKMVPPKYGREKLDKIIAEERRHVVQLNALRKKI